MKTKTCQNMEGLKNRKTTSRALQSSMCFKRNLVPINLNVILNTNKYNLNFSNWAKVILIGGPAGNKNMLVFYI